MTFGAVSRLLEQPTRHYAVGTTEKSLKKSLLLPSAWLTLSLDFVRGI
jgi:hypothetical protein